MDLLERTSALRELDELLAGTPGGGRLVLVSGEAGVGKSALVDRFAERHGLVPAGDGEPTGPS
jgi:KaiC/GvpD/RAD55 family RecA-like ATPase